MSEAADLSGFDVRATSQDGVDMVLLDPAGRRTQVVFRVRGTDSKAYQEATQARIRKQQELLPRKVTEEESNAMFMETQASLIVSWTPSRVRFEKDGEELECTLANVAGVLQRHPWIHEQVIRFSDRRANFLPGSSSS